MDLSNVFIEAQKTANTIVTQAKENARKMDDDAKKLANQVVDDANGKASTIVKNADDKANRILTDAEDKSSEMRAAADSIKTTVTNEIADIESNVSKLRDILEAFSNESISKLNETKSVISATQSALRQGKAPSTSTTSPKPAPAPAHAPNPAPAPVHNSAVPPKQEPAKQPAPAPAPAAPAHKPAPKFSNFGFDLSEIENMAKAIEAEASKDNSAAANEKKSDYEEDDTITPSHIKLSDMM